MKCNSITINELAESMSGTPEYLGHTGEGDQRISLWLLPNGEELIDTNGEPVGECMDGFAEMRAAIVAGADA